AGSSFCAGSDRLGGLVVQGCRLDRLPCVMLPAPCARSDALRAYGQAGEMATPAEAEPRPPQSQDHWIPASAGMTNQGFLKKSCTATCSFEALRPCDTPARPARGTLRPSAACPS